MHREFAQKGVVVHTQQFDLICGMRSLQWLETAKIQRDILSKTFLCAVYIAILPTQNYVHVRVTSEQLAGTTIKVHEWVCPDMGNFVSCSFWHGIIY